MIKDNVIVGHLPRKISLVSSVFISRGGTILCFILGRSYFSDLQQGGFEMPCILLYKDPQKEIDKLSVLLARTKQYGSLFSFRSYIPQNPSDVIIMEITIIIVINNFVEYK